MSGTEKLINIINQVLLKRRNTTISELDDKLHLRNDLHLDSLDLAELTVRIEAEFDVDVFEDGIINTIQELKIKIGI